MPRFRFGRMPMRGLVWMAALAIGLSGLAEVAAQNQNSGVRTTTKTSPAKKTIPPAGAEEPAVGNKPIRPAPPVMRVKEVPAELKKLLDDWEASSAKIKKLEGEHRRWEYDYVFNVVKHNTGKFYYEAPNKGRIDLIPAQPKVDPKTRQVEPEARRHWENGQKVQFKGEAGPAERWYCDGQLVTQVDVQQKQATRMLLPKQMQGENIIDGPLPFLFGMPAQKAIQRYDLELKNLNPSKNQATIRAIPRWPTDAANYQLAEIILDTKEFLPTAVRLIDPAGTKETVFVFGEMKKNSRNLLPEWLGGNPFKFEDRSYKIVNKVLDEERAEQPDGSGGKIVQASGVRPSEKPAVEGAEKTAPANGAKSKLSTLPPDTVPSVIGMDHAKAKEILQTLGYKVLLKQGSPANRAAQLYRVERQQPDAKSKLAEGETVTLWLFIKPKVSE